MNNLPKIAILGYGSMGKEIERISLEKKLIITDIFDIDKPILENKTYDFDVAIDFSHSSGLIDNLSRVSKLKKNYVIGTTGWENSLDLVKQITENSNIGVVYGSNFSIGMQIFQRLVSLASITANGFEDYDIFMHELHHKRKKDSPSGTALSLAKIILHNVERKTEVLGDSSKDQIKPNELHVSSTRGGEIAGTHTIYLDSLADTIEITHRAKNRSGFALGAVNAAIWLAGKTGFYEFSEIFPEII
jgi:4-hydroxy-tetrahydrodipicolinate reductase